MDTNLGALAEKIDFSRTPGNWKSESFDASGWKKAVELETAAEGHEKFLGILKTFRLEERPIPLCVEEEATLDKELGEPVLGEKEALTVEPEEKKVLLFDGKTLFNAYFRYHIQGGKGAEISFTYFEKFTKGRDEVKRDDYRNGEIGNNGRTDRIFPAGGDLLYEPFWYHTMRFLKIEIQAGEEAVKFYRPQLLKTGYPLRPESEISSTAEWVQPIYEMCVRTLQDCMMETYMDCPYYEQLQYFGDTRIQALITLYNTRDRYMARNAIEQGRQSIVSDGITMSRYPSGIHQFISSFSLYWICMGHDYWRYRGEEEYLKTLLPAYRGVLSWYEGFLKEDFSLAFVPHWFFGDWASNFEAGEPFREKDGNSAFQDLLFVMGLEAAADMEEAFGIPSYGKRYRETASSIKRTIKEKYWDAERGLFSDTRDRRNYSQHVNVLAILNEAVEGDEARAVMERTLADTTLTQTTIYFRYYLNQALKKAGLGDRLLDNMQVWEDQMALGLSTWAEQPEPSRSDCHAWGSSPNIEFFRTILGIDSDGPGFSRILIEPSLGKLKEVSGTMPHPRGDIAVKYRVGKKGSLSAEITLPEGVEGELIWNGERKPLHGGFQQLTVR